MFPDHATLPNAGASGGSASGGTGGESSGGSNSAGLAGGPATGGAAGAGLAGSAGLPSAGAMAGGEGGGAGRGGVGAAGGAPETGGAGGAPTVQSGGQGGSVGCSPVVLRLVATADAHLSEAKDDQRNNFGSATRLLLSGVVDARARSLVNFDLSALPSGQYVAGATLRVVVAAPVAGERTLSVYRVGREWQEDKATWVRASTMPNTNWALPGGDTALVFSDTQTLLDASPGTAVDFQVALDLEGVSGSNPGFGWLVDVAASEDVVELSSRESLFAGERPELVLELCPNGNGS